MHVCPNTLSYNASGHTNTSKCAMVNPLHGYACGMGLSKNFVSTLLLLKKPTTVTRHMFYINIYFRRENQLMKIWIIFPGGQVKVT